MSIKIDRINISIIKHLNDGRKSFKEIATKLSITENTVRSRVNTMIKEGILTIKGLVDPELIPNHQLILIGVKLKTVDLVNKGREFSNLKGVLSASVVTGRYDLILTVLLNEDFSLLQFYTDEVSRIEDVMSVETFVVYKGYKNFVPYVL